MVLRENALGHISRPKESRKSHLFFTVPNVTRSEYSDRLPQLPDFVKRLLGRRAPPRTLWTTKEVCQQRVLVSTRSKSNPKQHQPKGMSPQDTSSESLCLTAVVGLGTAPTQAQSLQTSTHLGLAHQLNHWAKERKRRNRTCKQPRLCIS